MSQVIRFMSYFSVRLSSGSTLLTTLPILGLVRIACIFVTYACSMGQAHIPSTFQEFWIDELTINATEEVVVIIDVKADSINCTNQTSGQISLQNYRMELDPRHVAADVIFTENFDIVKNGSQLFCADLVEVYIMKANPSGYFEFNVKMFGCGIYPGKHIPQIMSKKVNMEFYDCVELVF